jgi:cytochrome P460
MTKTFLRRALALALCASATAFAADAPRVAFPDGYRQWTHVKSMQILPGHPLHDAFGGLHHLYANRQAMAGYRSGRFPDGAVIAFDLLQAETANNAVTEGSREVVGIMRKDARRFAATGGWGVRSVAARRSEIAGRAGQRGGRVLQLPHGAEGPRLRVQRVSPVTVRLRAPGDAARAVSSAACSDSQRRKATTSSRSATRGAGSAK